MLCYVMGELSQWLWSWWQHRKHFMAIIIIMFATSFSGEDRHNMVSPAVGCASASSDKMIGRLTTANTNAMQHHLDDVLTKLWRESNLLIMTVCCMVPPCCFVLALCRLSLCCVWLSVNNGRSSRISVHPIASRMVTTGHGSYGSTSCW